MTRLIMKPVHWNPEGYRGPAGHRASDGYPAKWGFGHEEWNNADGMEFVRDGVQYRAFHTEPAGRSADDEEGNAVVFMYASHGREQKLVGVAARATDLTDRDAERARVRRKLPIKSHFNDVLRLLQAGRLPVRNEARLTKRWKGDEPYLPRWICPSDCFLWLDNPVVLNPMEIRKTGKFFTMFSGYTALKYNEAYLIMDAIPKKLRKPAWYRIREAIGGSLAGLLADLDAIKKDRTVDKTTRKQLIDARCGQGRFRRDVMKRWGAACAVTGCTVVDALRASHILSWRDSSNRQRLDPNNGLLLVASIDALFDKALISFGNDGTMLVAPSLSRSDRKILAIPRSLRKPIARQQRTYLASHRNRFAHKSEPEPKP
ncbi:putative restriction endonuclease [Tahibacter aquaticus]|uniref:Putative restriction endonuclease n=1 Tax=Tahibacter aquaticus TaxID=520092 RepID=A0A4R6YH91_9GAMM|nr:HNH endonuclease [Tahibacter aquaticus]TDR36061.1 putative restriction endonuclease [Tahibacter aquaticus]